MSGGFGTDVFCKLERNDRFLIKPVAALTCKHVSKPLKPALYKDARTGNHYGQTGFQRLSDLSCWQVDGA